jgi:hypothetical protein
MKTIQITAALAALFITAAAGPLRAQESDPRWLPWIGCWQPVDDDSSADLLCIRPSGAGVEVSEIVDSRVSTTHTLAADGRAYPLEIEGCKGTRTAEFSTDGHRIFTVNEESCDGEESRSSTGLIAMVAPDEWIDVQAAQEDGKGLGWARRYRPASAQAAADAGFGDLGGRAGPAQRARLTAAAKVDVDDVIEALKRVDPEGVRTWIAELRDPFVLDRRQLLRLADANVPPNVIDVMVAVSYPDRFALGRDGDIEPIVDGPVPGRGRRGGYYGPRRGFFGPLYPYYGGYGGYGYGGYDPYYGPGVVIVQPRRDPEPNAKVVNGRGYTRGRDSGGSSGSGSGSKVQEPKGSSDSGSSTTSDPAKTSGDSDSGRKARPR